MGFRPDGPSEAKSFHSTMASSGLDFGCVCCYVVLTCRISIFKTVAMLGAKKKKHPHLFSLCNEEI